jgi:chaperonin GroES
MSKTLYVPDHVLEKLKDPNKGVDPNRKELDKLPQPVGWRILVLPFKAKDKTKGGVLLTDKTVEDSQLTATVALVLATGPDAYNDNEKFPNGPWCKQGDWVVFGRYAGSRLKIDGGEVRLLNDDEILGTVESPEDVLTII